MFDPDRRFLFVPDKGLDRIFVLTVDPNSGKLAFNATPSIQTREGAGPRHIVFHPSEPFAYVVNELDSTVAVYAWDRERGELRPIEVMPTIPSDFVGKNRSAEIAISAFGQHVYASNRGHDSVGFFEVDGTSGKLLPVAWTSTGGRGPRFFTLDPDEDRLYAANELTDSIVEFRRSRDSGTLAQTGCVIGSGTPVCILFAPG
jgi:6-phosphogluconolactonase (cycloisomerase 2 family)